jgi:hypothetical protein
MMLPLLSRGSDSDPCFKAGRTLIQSGRANEGAVDIFATLLEVRGRNDG